MRIAFHAPLKPPGHPTPSGDRAMARAFLGLLAELGHEVDEPCRLRTFDRHGDGGRALRLERLADRLATRLLRRWSRHGRAPQLWFTYHNHHKAPDLLGPRLAAALDIPYIVAEASHAAKQAAGPWAVGLRQAARAIGAADVILAMTSNDRAGLDELRPTATICHFPPFLDRPAAPPEPAGRAALRRELARRYGRDPAEPWLIAVAMMRADVKRDSFLLLAEALGRLGGRPWSLFAVGDGPARPAIAGALDARCPGRWVATGQLEPVEVGALLAACDLYVWPALREAYGLAILEALAAGLPVVAGAEGGVPDLVADGDTGLLVGDRDPVAFAAAIGTLLDDPDRRAAMGRAAARRVRQRHGRPVARGRLHAALRLAVERHRQRVAA
jgi:glycosyltransferase involved in cell wall biosynthesis